MKLYFGNTVTNHYNGHGSCAAGFHRLHSVWSQRQHPVLGAQNCILFAFGLVICCFAATRDGLDKTVQCDDGSCRLAFSRLSTFPQSLLHWGVPDPLAAIATPIVKNAADAPVLVYLMSGGIV